MIVVFALIYSIWIERIACCDVNNMELEESLFRHLCQRLDLSVSSCRNMKAAYLTQRLCNNTLLAATDHVWFYLLYLLACF
jgi:hypothetical protein